MANNKTSFDLDDDVKDMLNEHCNKYNKKKKDVVNTALRNHFEDITNKELFEKIKIEIDKI